MDIHICISRDEGYEIFSFWVVILLDRESDETLLGITHQASKQKGKKNQSIYENSGAYCNGRCNTEVR